MSPLIGNQLPELPRVLNKKEARFGTTTFTPWFIKNARKHFTLTPVFELKQTETSLPFSRVEKHQERKLWSAKYGVSIYKISDESRGEKPFDSIGLMNCEAYLVIKYPKHFYIIDIDDWLNEVKRSTRRSLTEERADEICKIKV